MEERALLQQMFDAAVQAAASDAAVPPHSPAPPSGRTASVLISASD